MMERTYPTYNEKKIEWLKQQADKGSELVKALAECSQSRYRWKSDRILDELAKLADREPVWFSAKDFFRPELETAVKLLAGEEVAKELPHIAVLRLKSYYDRHDSQRCYRSRYMGYYVREMADLVRNMIELSTMEKDTKALLYHSHDLRLDFEFLLAREICKGNAEIIALIREAMVGDNSQIELTGRMIEAILISGHEELLNELLNLLLHAGLQEGLRQRILEPAFMGSTETLRKVLKFCIDHGLHRYSSMVRAFDVWTFLAYDETKPDVMEGYMRMAYDCLTDEALRREYFQSDNKMKTYFALWAQGCHEVTDMHQMLPQLLDDPRKYKKLLGWMVVDRTGSQPFQMKLAVQHLDERDPELLAWIVRSLNFTPSITTASVKKEKRLEPRPNGMLPSTREERRQIFDQLKILGPYIGNKEQHFSDSPFAYTDVTLYSDRVYWCMFSLAAYDMDLDMIEALFGLYPQMKVDLRCAFLAHFLDPDAHEQHRQFLREALKDRSVIVKEAAAAYFGHCTLVPDDLRALAEALRSKSSSLRKQIMTILFAQPAALLRTILPEMLESKVENQNQAALEVLNKHREYLPENRQAVDELRKRDLSTQTRILLDQLPSEEKKQEAWTEENGYGLYDPAELDRFVEKIHGEKLEEPTLLGKLLDRKSDKERLLSERQLKAMLPSKEEVEKLFARLEAVFTRHADHAYEINDYGGSRREVLFGDNVRDLRLPAECGCRELYKKNARLHMVPFYEEFMEAFGDYATDIRKMLGLNHLLSLYGGGTEMYSGAVILPWFEEIEKKKLAPYFDSLWRKKYPRFSIYERICVKLPFQLESSLVFREAFQIYKSMIAVIGEENLHKNYLEPVQELSWGRWPIVFTEVINHRMLGTWRFLIQNLKLSREDFAQWFLFEYRLEHPAREQVLDRLSLEDHLRAFHERVVSEDVLAAFLVGNPYRFPFQIRELTGPKCPGAEEYPWLPALKKKVVGRIVEVEQRRGELPTPLTAHACEIKQFEGVKHFCSLLAALGKENFYHGYEYQEAKTKQAALSRLLKRCRPAMEDTPEALLRWMKELAIPENRMAEAVMYAPQWAGLAEKAMGWPGLKSAVWFFHAHINESFSAEKETEVAIYSPITPLRFNDGAFDRNWFFTAYEALGETRFRVLHKSAKYISDSNSLHRRSQLYADAASGKLDGEALRAEIVQKRNQEKLRCYPVLPMAEGDRHEALRRYEFIQQFRKESKQFGAQRRESEQKACDVAMENLAINTGLMDVNRLMWQMESFKIKELQPLFEPTELDALTFWLEIDAEGDAAMRMQKAGKPVKTVPKALTKHDSVLVLKAAVKELKELKRRSRESLERAMMESTEFGAEELRNICGNPVLAPVMAKLVWTDGTNNGFLSGAGETLMTRNGDILLQEDTKLRIAHPHDLKTAGEWAEYMRLVYEKRLVQPFKQVFREYYPMTGDEKREGILSRRYAGHQVQPQKAAALLKGRGWTVDYEQGLQRVYYKENLIARIYAMADWFSPAEYEAPTLEVIQFFDRNTGAMVPLEQVPPILFSETMRDLDLAVSVAHVGGVDPETSQSTVEMRVAIASELAALLKLQNVSWIGSHAKIHGQLANYSVHMGSGVVHAEGVGMLAILPVHAQARGRIFLPFADDDPRTAEIMSKIILLAEDKKLKDPTILGQLH